MSTLDVSKEAYVCAHNYSTSSMKANPQKRMRWNHLGYLGEKDCKQNTAKLVTDI